MVDYSHRTLLSIFVAFRKNESIVIDRYRMLSKLWPPRVIFLIILSKAFDTANDSTLSPFSVYFLF